MSRERLFQSAYIPYLSKDYGTPSGCRLSVWEGAASRPSHATQMSRPRQWHDRPISYIGIVLFFIKVTGQANFVQIDIDLIVNNLASCGQSSNYILGQDK